MVTIIKFSCVSPWLLAFITISSFRSILYKNDISMCIRPSFICLLAPGGEIEITNGMIC